MGGKLVTNFMYLKPLILLKKLKCVLVLLPILFIVSCKNFEEINLSKVDDLKIKTLTKDGITAEVKVKIKNPNPIGFNVYRSACDVYCGDSYLGKAKLRKKVHVGANSNSEHTFVLSGKFKNMSMDQITALMSGRSQTLVFKGYLKAGKFFYKKKFPIDRKEKLNFSK